MAFVRSDLDYASKVRSGQSVQQMVMIEGVRRRATKFILGISGGEMSYEERLRKLNLIPLSYGHEMKDLLFLHGCVSGKYDIDLTFFNEKNVSTRSSSATFLIPKCRTQTFQRSFFVRTARIWNTLPISTQSHISYVKLKTILEIRARNNPSPTLPIYLSRDQVTLIIFQNCQKDKSPLL